MNSDRQRQHGRNHYRKNKAYYLAKNTKKRNEMRQWVQDIKARATCADCKQQFPHYVMDFDHLEGSDKAFNVSKLVARLSWDRLYEEISKCEIVCANDHRIRTQMRIEKARA